MSDFEFIELNPGTVALGWRFDHVVPEDWRWWRVNLRRKRLANRLVRTIAFVSRTRVHD